MIADSKNPTPSPSDKSPIPLSDAELLDRADTTLDAAVALIDKFEPTIRTSKSLAKDIEELLTTLNEKLQAIELPDSKKIGEKDAKAEHYREGILVLLRGMVDHLPDANLRDRLEQLCQTSVLDGGDFDPADPASQVRFLMH